MFFGCRALVARLVCIALQVPFEAVPWSFWISISSEEPSEQEFCFLPILIFVRPDALNFRQQRSMVPFRRNHRHNCVLLLLQTVRFIFWFQLPLAMFVGSRLAPCWPISFTFACHSNQTRPPTVGSAVFLSFRAPLVADILSQKYFWNHFVEAIRTISLPPTSWL